MKARYNLFLLSLRYPQLMLGENGQMKIWRTILCGAIILTGAFGFSCLQKAMRMEETPYSISREEQIIKEPKPQPKDFSSPASSAVETATAPPKISEKPLKEEPISPQAPLSATLKKDFEKKEARQAPPPIPGLQSIFFDFDQAVIREDQKETMFQNAQWLKANPQVRIRIEGNCDERGTAEYNLALGQRRAEAVKEFLMGLGISPTRMQTISYGFERPLDPRHNEEAWAKNRRVDFTILK